MSDVKWIKIMINIFDDEKIRLIETLPDAHALIVIWFKLLVMAGKCNHCGLVFLTRDLPYNEEMLSTIMRMPVNTIRLALNEFQRLGMIAVENNFISIVNWEKHQSLEKLEEQKEKQREKARKFRQKQKELLQNVTVTLPYVPPVELELDKEIDIYRGKPTRKRSGFVKPTIEEIKKWREDEQLGFLSDYRIQYVYNHYESKDWMIGKNKMKDWKAAFRNSESWNIQEPKKSQEDEMQKLYGDPVYAKR